MLIHFLSPDVFCGLKEVFLPYEECHYYASLIFISLDFFFFFKRQDFLSFFFLVELF